MKRTFQLMVLAVIVISLASCEDKKIVTFTELPQSAQTYIQENVADAKVVYIKKEKDFFRTKYEVRFDNQLELEFKGDGTLVDVDVND